MHRLLHVITAANNLTTPAIAASLDAMKAFDRIEWQFLLFTLSKFHFGPFFMHWVKTLYEVLVSSVKTNEAYKINWSKSEAMPLNQRTTQVHLAGTPFIWKSKGMKYLGIDFISPITEMFITNGPKLLVKIKDDIKRWTVLPKSIWGRVETLKMNILPRVIYILSAIPTFFPSFMV